MDSPSLHPAARTELTRFVRGVQRVTREPDAAPHVRLPDGEVDLILRPSAREGIEAYVVGARMRVLRKSAAELPQAVAVRFKAGGAYPFFGVPMSELAERIVPLDALWGAEGRRLREALSEAPTHARRLHLLEEALSARLHGSRVFEPASAYLVRRAIRHMNEATELPRVGDLASTLDISARQLRRAFDDVVGVGPRRMRGSCASSGPCVPRSERPGRTGAPLPRPWATTTRPI